MENEKETATKRIEHAPCSEEEESSSVIFATAPCCSDVAQSDVLRYTKESYRWVPRSTLLWFEKTVMQFTYFKVCVTARQFTF